MFFFSGPNFEAKDIPDLTSKIAIITGASNGIGKECAFEMARKGCHCVLACRSEERTRVVIDEIVKVTGNTKVEFMPLDLASFKSVTAFAEAYQARFDKLDILLNNAGYLCTEGWTVTEDGLETTFQINYAGNVLLTLLLLPVLQKSAPSRVVNVSSDAHRFIFSLNTKDYNDKAKYSKMMSYGRSKFALTMFTTELARRLKKHDIKGVYVNSLHPGSVQTDMLDKVSGYEFLQGIVRFLSGSIKPDQGALTQLYVAVSPEIEQKELTGEYFVPIAKLSSSNSGSRNEAHATELWNYTQDILSEKVPGFMRSSLKK
ncbi:hypothetical protein BC940DRAFT_308002 [Gongronella butleri]|nr:hypothetical protein BC940DRAFT_308002 [Gongronella butleri]